MRLTPSPSASEGRKLRRPGTARRPPAARGTERSGGWEERGGSRAKPGPAPGPAPPLRRSAPGPAPPHTNRRPVRARPPEGAHCWAGARPGRCGAAPRAAVGDPRGGPQRFPAARRAFILYLGAVNPRRVPTHLPAARRLGIQNGGRPALTQWRRIGAPRSAPPAARASASLAPSPPGRAPSRRAPFRRERPGQSGGRTFSSPPSPRSRGGMRAREPRVLPPPLPEWLRP